MAEVAIAVAVLAIVIGAMVPAFLSIRVAEQARATAQNLQTVMRSIAGFVQSNGCVPCPISPENVLGTNVACTTCNDAVGIVPFQALGLPQSYAKDAYGHWLTYAVDTKLASHSTTPPSKALPVNGPDGLCSLTFSASTALKVKLNSTSSQNNIAVMLLSHGANGRGAYRNDPTFNNDRILIPMSLCVDGGNENCNASNSTSFVAATPAQGDNPFDDVFLYLDRNSLVTYLGNQGCSTPW